MVRYLETYIWFLFFSIWTNMGFGQSHLWTEVQVSPSYAYIGQPVEVTVSVYSSTWFTKGVNVQNIQVNDAFTVYFRSLSTSKIIKGKTYAGVQFFYNVFPYSDKDVIFPSLEIWVETPDDGGYKGVKRKVVTKSKHIKIKPIPPGFESEDWLVTTQMTVYDNWTGDLKNVKVGDVLERSIHREADGTVSELIPPIRWDSLEGVSMYPDRLTVQNNKSKTAISAERTDRMRYLFEKEGDIVFPEIQLTWWNPRYKKVYKRTLKKVMIHVQANPDLGMLATIKDSLNVQQQFIETAEEDQEFSFWGLGKEQWIKLIFAFIILGYLMVKWIWPVLKWMYQNYLKYKDSERYYFNQFLFYELKGSSKENQKALYRWMDEIELEEPTKEYVVQKFGNANKSVNEYGMMDWVNLRRKYLKRHISTPKSDWVNPI